LLAEEVKRDLVEDSGSLVADADTRGVDTGGLLVGADE
jgi:hypothetical protein